MFAQESVMDVEKEREAFEATSPFSIYINKVNSDGNKYTPIYYKDLDYAQIMSFGWLAWQAAKAQAVPEGFEIGRLQDRITELLDERQELYAQLDAGSTEGFILVEKDLVQSIHQSCVKCLDIDLPPIFRATVCTIRDEVAPLIEAQEPTND